MPELFTFAVYPADFGDRFEAFLLDVPTLIGRDAAARRAYWAALASLAQAGVEPEDFAVSAWDVEQNRPGEPVGPGGFLS